MNITGSLCKNCRTNDVFSETYQFYNDDNQLVAKLHQWVLKTEHGFQAKVVAKSQEWIDFETAELARERPNLFQAFYGKHPGVLILNSEIFYNEDQARRRMTDYFFRAKDWLDQRMGTTLEIV